MTVTKENRVFFFAILTLLGILAFITLRDYLSVLIIGYITVIIFKPVYEWLYQHTGRSTGIATTISVTAVFLVLFIPLLFILTITYQQARTLYDDAKHYLETQEISYERIAVMVNDYTDLVPNYDATVTARDVEEYVNDKFSSIINASLGKTVDVGTAIAGTLARSIPQLVVFVFVLAALFPAQQNLLRYLKRLSPLDDHVDDRYYSKFVLMAKAMVKGSLVIAVVQGVLSGIVLALMGVPYVFFWTILMIFLSIIPLGAGVVNLPIGIIMILSGDYVRGIIILAHHFIVITNIDNILRPRLVPREAELHPLLTLVSVLGGITAFGFWGVLYGPIIMILLVTTLDVYIKHYRHKDPQSNKA